MIQGIESYVLFRYNYRKESNNDGKNNKNCRSSNQPWVKLISLAIVLQVVFGHSVPFLGGNVIGTIIGIIQELGAAGLVGLIATLIIWRLHDEDIRKELSE